MKQINQFITEYIVKKKLDKPIDSEDHYDYYPETKDELIKVIQMLLGKGETDLNCIDTSKITDMSGLFTNIFNELVFDVSNWDVSNVENMYNMFSGCIKFNCDLSNWNVSNVTNMSYMFDNCTNFEGKGLNKWDVSNVEDMSGMFNGCINFEGKGLENWDVHNVKNMYCLFNNCIKFKGKSIENWDVNNVVNMVGTFYKCKKLNCDLSNWNVSNVENMNYMFKE